MKKDSRILATIFAIGGGATGFALSFLFIIGVNQEALFALVGAIIGAAATIGGAAWLQSWHRRTDRDAEHSQLLAEYRNLLEKALATKATEPGPGDAWPQNYRPNLCVLAEAAGDANLMCTEALTHGKSITFLHRIAARRVQFVINDYLQFWSDANSEHDLEDWDERSFSVMTAEIIRECEAAMKS